MLKTNIFGTIVCGIGTIVWMFNVNIEILYKSIIMGLLWLIYSATLNLNKAKGDKSNG